MRDRVIANNRKRQNSVSHFYRDRRNSAEQHDYQFLNLYLILPAMSPPKLAYNISVNWANVSWNEAKPNVLSRVEKAYSLLSDLLAKPSEFQKGPQFFSSAKAVPKKRNSAYSLTLQHDFEVVLRIWEGKSRHRQKSPCINSVNTIKNIASPAVRVLSRHAEKLADLTTEPWRGAAAPKTVGSNFKTVGSYERCRA